MECGVEWELEHVYVCLCLCLWIDAQLRGAPIPRQQQKPRTPNPQRPTTYPHPLPLHTPSTPPSQVENEEMITTLEALIETFSDDMAQYATQLAQHLATAFWRIQQQDEENEDDDDDTAALAAYGCVRTIGTLLEAVSTLPHLYPQVCGGGCWVWWSSTGGVCWRCVVVVHDDAVRWCMVVVYGGVERVVYGVVVWVLHGGVVWWCCMGGVWWCCMGGVYAPVPNTIKHTMHTPPSPHYTTPPSAHSLSSPLTHLPPTQPTTVGRGALSHHGPFPVSRWRIHF